MHFKATDVSKEADAKDLITFTVQKFGAVHVVVNSAGVAAVGLLVSKRGVLSSEDMQTVLEINVLGTLNVCKFAAVQMLK